MKNITKARIIILFLVMVMLAVLTPSYAATIGEQNALQSAISYLNFTNFSREGLISQLEYEGYTRAEATYAVDNCGADWNQQAVSCAQSYISFMSFSRSGLIDQLEYEGFTNEQAIYGVDNCKADWYEQAVICGQSYMSFSSFSRKSLHDQLIYEGFSEDQTSYALSIIFDASPTRSVPQIQATANPKDNISRSNGTIEQKTVTVPVGDYIVGEDIPAGSYTLTGNKYSVIRIYDDESKEYYSDSYEIQKPHYCIGKVTLINGMKVQVVYASMDFTTFIGLDDISNLEKGGSVYIPVGDYIVGEDIPAGKYSLSSESYAVLRVYKNSNAKYYDNHYECEKPDYTVGKITLQDGMRIIVVYDGITFGPFKGLGF